MKDSCQDRSVREGPMISDEDIDLVLLANITTQWRKVAHVVGTTMMLIDPDERGGRDDLYFAKRVAVLAEKGLIESAGNLSDMGRSEVRLSSKSPRDSRQFPPGWTDPVQSSDNIDRKLLRVKRLVNQALYEEALADCGKLLSSDPEHKDKILRVRAHAFAGSGDDKNAVRDHELVINGGSPELRDYYLGAFRAISAEQLDKAVIWSEELLKLGREQKKIWFESATLFYLSYAHMKLGDYDRAIQYLDEAIRVESDIAMPVPEGMCHHTHLREEIDRRKNTST
jgi:tetratricopeptide (TPR) repeat protein